METNFTDDLNTIRADDLNHTNWTCDLCKAENSCLDGECQFCEFEEPEEVAEYEQWLDESMDGDHESALESVYGPND